MKTYFLFLVLSIASVSFGQNNYIVKTDDGRRVLLKSDFKAKAVYRFCANGKEVTYKRMGTTVIKKVKLF